MVGRVPQGESSETTRNPIRGHKIEVFPHGEIELRAFVTELARSYDEPAMLGFAGSGLRRFQALNSGVGDEVVPRIARHNYWASNSPAKWPDGCYQGAHGLTRVWLDCWQWTNPDLWSPPHSKSSWLARRSSFASDGRIDYSDGSRLGHIEVSCLTWHFSEMGDWGTSIVVEPVHLFSTSPINDVHRDLVARMADAIKSKLLATPAPPGAAEKRHQRDVAIATARHNEEAAARALEEQRLRALDEERQKAEAARRIELEQLRNRRVAVIYDSCYLMEGRAFVHKALVADAGSIFNFVPNQVIDEIAGILEADDGRRKSAARGRGQILDLKAEGERLQHRASYREIDISGIEPVARQEPFDADSDIDRRLIAFGLQLCEENPGLAVVIASCDGGIGWMVDRLRKQTDRPIFRVNDPRDLTALAAIRKAIVATG